MQVEQVRPETEDAALAQEANLVEQARADPEAFARLYDQYVTRIYRYAYRHLGSHADAEDLTAQTFHRALERFDSYQWRGLPFGAWLFRIAHNLIVDRRRGSGPPLSLDFLSSNGQEWSDPKHQATVDRLIAREETDAAWSLIAALPPRQRRAIVLRFGQELSNAEVGVTIGRSEAATKQLIYRGIRTVRERLGVRGG
ncbi:MAG: RNA polymerase sigma factor [Dehalococcoidia bacterium]